MDKAPDAFRTISEVADLLETPAHVLRFWETRFPQVKPVKGAGGRRYYRPADVALLAGIRQLLHNDGMTIRGVQKILRDQGVHHVAELGGAEPAAPEALADLLPPARPEAEVVALRPSSPPAREAAPPAPETSVAEPPRPAAPRWSSAPLGDTPPAPWSPPEPAPLPALLAEGLAPPTEEVKEPVAFAPPMGSIGGFGLDLDAPREGSGGFIAFSDAREPAPPSKPEGLVHPDARPKAPKGEAPPRQPSLFDFSPEDGLTEEEADEAPFIHIAEEPAPLSDITPFAPESDRESDPEVAIAALMAEEAPEPEAPAAEEGLRADDLGAESWATEEEAGPEDARFEDATSEDATSEDTGFEGASFEGLGREDFPGPAPGAADDASDDLQADDWSISPPDSPPDAESTAPLVPQLAGLAPRLRRLGPLSPEALLPLADLQARLGLLHAQMVEAQGRSRRTPGA